MPPLEFDCSDCEEDGSTLVPYDEMIPNNNVYIRCGNCGCINVIGIGGESVSDDEKP